MIQTGPFCFLEILMGVTTPAPLLLFPCGDPARETDNRSTRQ